MRKYNLLYALLLAAAIDTAAQSPYTGGIGSGYQAGQSAFSSCMQYTGGDASGASNNLSAATTCVFYFGGNEDGAASNQSAAVDCFPFAGGEGDGYSMNNSNCENEEQGIKEERSQRKTPGNILSFDKSAVPSSIINIYPNPAQASATLYYYSTRDFSTMCTMYQNDGRVVMSTRLSIKQGANYLRLDLQHTSNGFYYIRLSETNTVVKLIVQRR